MVGDPRPPPGSCSNRAAFDTTDAYSRPAALTSTSVVQWDTVLVSRWYAARIA